MCHSLMQIQFQEWHFLGHPVVELSSVARRARAHWPEEKRKKRAFSTPYTRFVSSDF